MKPNKTKCLILALAAVAMAASSANAEEWIVPGGRARGMGGAGVASERNPYWNPAVIFDSPRKPKDQKDPKTPGAPKEPGGFKLTDIFSEIDVALQGSFEITLQGDIAAEADDIIDLMTEKDFAAVQARLDAGTASMADIEFAIVLLQEIEDLNRDGEGIYAMLGGSGYFRLGKNLALTVGTFVWSAADPYVDLTAFSSLSSGGFTTLLAAAGTTGQTPATSDGQFLSAQLQAQGIAVADADQLAYIAEQSGVNLSDPEVLNSIVLAGETTLSDPTSILLENKSGFTLNGLILTEVGISVSIPLLNDVLSVGATAKLMHGITFKREFVLKDVEKGQEIIDDTYTDFQSHRLESFQFGLDVGVVFRPLKLVTFGFCAKNISHPSFPVYGTNDFVLYPQFRAGVLVTPIKGVNLALDIDVITNRSEALSGFESQIVASGIEIVPLDNALIGLAIRTGAYRNLAMRNEEIVWTAGLSARLWAFEFEIAGSSSAYNLTMADIEKTTTGGTSDPNPIREVTKRLPERFGIGATLRLMLKF